MAPPRRSEMLFHRGLPGLPVEPVNDASSDTIAGNLHAGTSLGVPTDTMASSVVPSCAVELATGWLAASLDVQQPMEVQRSGPDSGVLSLAGFDPTQPEETTPVSAAYFAHDFGSQSEGNRASPSLLAFQPYQKRADALSNGTGCPMWNPVDAAPDGLPGSLGLGPEINPLFELEPLTPAEEMETLLVLEHRRTMQNADSLSPHLHEPNYLGEQFQAVNYDPVGGFGLPLRGVMPYSPIHPQSLRDEHHHQNPQQPLIDLDGGLPQLMRGAPFRGTLSSEPCAMYPVYSNPGIIAPIVPATVQDIVEAAPTMNITPLDLLAQPPAKSPAAHVADQSTNAAPTNHVELVTQIVTEGEGQGGGGGQGGGNRPTHRFVASGGKRRRTEPTPTRDGTVAPPRNNSAQAMLDVLDTQRKKHILAEKQRRSITNRHYDTIRSLLPAAQTKKPCDTATLVLNMYDFIKHCRSNLDVLESQLEQHHEMAARNRVPPSHGSSAAETPVPRSGALTCIDRTRDASALTAVTTIPAVGRESCLTSFLGTNVALHVCGQNCFLTISSPHLDRTPILLYRIAAVVLEHDLIILNLTLVSRDNTDVYSLQCQGGADVDLLGQNLHSQLQSVVDAFVASFTGAN